MVFEELEPVDKNKKKKRRRSSFFEYKVEVPRKNIDSIEKAKELSEHKEILPIQTYSKNPKEDQEREEAAEEAQKILEKLGDLVRKCEECKSQNIKFSENHKIIKFECRDCGYKWEEELNEES